VLQYREMKRPFIERAEDCLLMAEKIRGTVLPRLRAWREARALNQTELADQAGVARSTVSRGESGHIVAWPNVRKLAAALGISSQVLLQQDPPHSGTDGGSLHARPNAHLPSDSPPGRTS
jgi:DNA-binding XRE family transcriptional regulator